MKQNMNLENILPVKFKNETEYEILQRRVISILLYTVHVW